MKKVLAFLLASSFAVTVPLQMVQAEPAKTPGTVSKSGHRIVNIGGRLYVVNSKTGKHRKSKNRRISTTSTPYTPKVLSKGAIKEPIVPAPMPPAKEIGQASDADRMYRQDIRSLEMMLRFDRQIELIQEGLKSTHGPRGVSSILNSTNDKKLRRSAPHLNSILLGLDKDGSVPKEVDPALAERIEQFKSTFDMKGLDKLGEEEVTDAYSEDDQKFDKGIQQNGYMAMIAAGVAEDSYSRASKSMNRLNAYIELIDLTADLKASIDLNSRLVAESIQMQNELLRLQSSITMMNAGQTLQGVSGHLYQKRKLKF